MAGISTTGGSWLPTPQTQFADAGTAAPSTTLQPGPTVAGPGGTTTLPAASPADFASVNPTPLDQPHPQYPALIQSHVAVLQAIGTPEAVIAQLNAEQPQAEYMDRYIQGEIMQNPEGWDAYVGNAPGTARAGLQRLMPDLRLPAQGTGNAGYLPDGSPVNGINVPGITTPMMTTPLLDPTTGQPQAGEGEGLIKGLVIAAAVVGVGLIGWKLMKGRGASKGAEEVAKALGGGGTNGPDGIRNFINAITSGKLKGADATATAKALQLELLSGGAVAGMASDVASTAAAGQRAAGLFAHANNIGPVDGFLMQATAGATAANISVESAAKLMLANRNMGVMERAVMNGGGIADLALANMTGLQLAGGAGSAAAGATKLAGLQSMLTGLAASLT